MAMIFDLSSRSSFAAVAYIHISDKLVHFILYAGLSASLLIGARKAPFTRMFSPYWLVFILAVYFGVSDEYHQGFVPNRTVDIMDWLADTAGAAFGLIMIALLLKLRRRRNDAREQQ